MCVWTLQDVEVWKQFQKDGVCQANSNFVEEYYRGIPPIK